MKITKLSLAVLVAVGSFSFANAGSLEDAIKNVDFSGYLRYRYTNSNNDSGASGEHAFKSNLKLKFDIDDNLFFGGFLQYNNKDLSGELTNTNTKAYFGVKEAYLGYKNDATTVVAGRQEISSLFTDDVTGTGIKLTNTSIPGLTLALAAYDSLEADGDIEISVETTSKNNLFAAAAIGEYDVINFQLWAAKLKHITQLYALELGKKFGNFDLKAQASSAIINKSLTSAKDASLANGLFLGAQGTYENDSYSLSLGYLNYGTKKDKKSLASYEDFGGLISAGELMLGLASYEGKNNIIFAAGSYNITDSVKLGADVLVGNQKTKAASSEVSTNKFEWVLRSEYAYNKKMKFKTYYAKEQDKQKGLSNKVKSDKFRFEARYTF